VLVPLYLRGGGMSEVLLCLGEVPGGRNESKQVRGVNGFGEFGLQEYLARKKPSPPWTLR